MGAVAGKDPRYWHSRGYLPHFDQAGFLQFITFRLADSMPQEVLAGWLEELKAGKISDAGLRRRIEHYLDQNLGSRVLRQHLIANIIQETLLKWDGIKYRLIAWVIMPNHVHLLLELLDGHALRDVMHSIKSYTAHAANRHLNRSGRFWAKEYFDRFIRDMHHYANAKAYIANNPVKAGLCERPEDWPHGSAAMDTQK